MAKDKEIDETIADVKTKVAKLEELSEQRKTLVEELTGQMSAAPTELVDEEIAFQSSPRMRSGSLERSYAYQGSKRGQPKISKTRGS